MGVEAMVNSRTLVEIQDEEFLVLCEILRICTVHNIQYFITGGTLLGSVYYQDFIPYDDDIDIAMDRKNYDLFLSYAPQEISQNYIIRHFSIDENFKYSIIRVENSDVNIYEANDPDKKISHPSIDIAPLDGSPENPILRRIFFYRLLFLRGLLSWHYSKTINVNMKRSRTQQLMIMILKLTSSFGRMLDPTKIKIKIDKLLSKYPLETSSYAGTFMGAYREREMIPQDIWGSGKNTYRFRDLILRGPENPKKYIKSLYGSFRVYSDEEALRNRHYMIFKDTSSEEKGGVND